MLNISVLLVLKQSADPERHEMCASHRRIVQILFTIVFVFICICFAVVHSFCNEKTVAFKIDNVAVVDSIWKPKSDSKLYRGLIFPNGFQVLLISDRNSQTASMAVSVGVGSLQDDDRLPGQAHLLEHMMFLGTKKVLFQFSCYIFRNLL